MFNMFFYKSVIFVENGDSVLVHLSRLHNILICTGDLLYILFCVAYEDFISYFGMYVGKILIGRFHKRPINADYHDLLTLTCGACQFVLGILTNGEVTPPPSSLHPSLSGRGFGLGCVGVLFGCVGNEGLRRGRTHPPQAVPPPFQGGLFCLGNLSECLYSCGSAAPSHFTFHISHFTLNWGSRSFGCRSRRRLRDSHRRW